MEQLFYHGSTRAGLTELTPSVPVNGELALVYLTTNPVLAAIYAVHPVEQYFISRQLHVPKPCYQFYPYGFDPKNGTLILDEYYPDAFADTYSGRQGTIYLCQKPTEYWNPTKIDGVLATGERVKITEHFPLPNVAEQLLTYEKQGLLRIQYYDSMPEQRRNALEQMMCEEIRNTKNDENGALRACLRSLKNDIID